MDAFLRWFFIFMTTMLDGLWMILSGIGRGFVQIFNFPLYLSQFFEYSSSFTVVDWIFAVLASLIVWGIWGFAIYLLVLVIRKYIRFRHSIVGQEDILEELAETHREVVKLTEEKEKILAMKISGSEVSIQDIRSILGNGEEEEPTYARERVFVTDGAGGMTEKSAAGTEGGALAASTLGATAAAVAAGAADSKPRSSKPSRFIRLSEVDHQYEFYTPPEYDTTIQLEALCERFRHFAAYKMGLYYDIKIVRLFFAGIASTKMLLLQGISGTGKTSLPYSMGKFLKCDATIAAVQPSWRDRTELFGYFNEFTKRFNETEVLRRIYESSYNDNINMIVLDEMNIARVEYYFAEMLSILEMPDHAEWKLDLVTSSWDNDPKHLANGKLVIPENLWYIGTANNDDSTFSVSDKVYDRALVINLDSKGVEFQAPETESISLSEPYMHQLFSEAIATHPVSTETLTKIANLDIYIIQKFRVAFGNRIMKQLKEFVPVFVACGGTELEGVDYLLTTKVFRKFESLNLSVIRDEVKGLIMYLDKAFGKGVMTESIAYLQRLQKLF